MSMARLWRDRDKRQQASLRSTAGSRKAFDTLDLKVAKDSARRATLHQRISEAHQGGSADCLPQWLPEGLGREWRYHLSSWFCYAIRSCLQDGPTNSPELLGDKLGDVPAIRSSTRHLRIHLPSVKILSHCPKGPSCSVSISANQITLATLCAGTPRPTYGDNKLCISEVALRSR